MPGPRVGLFAANRVDRLVRAAAVPRDLVELPAQRAGRAGTAGLLPLGLGRHPVPVSGGVPLDGLDAMRRRQTLAVGQRAAEPDRVPRRDARNGQLVVFRVVRPRGGDLCVPRLGDRAREQVGRELDRPAALRSRVRPCDLPRRDGDHLVFRVCAHR